MRRQRPAQQRHAKDAPRQLLNRALDLDELVPVPRLASKIGIESPSIGEYLQSRSAQRRKQKARSLVSLRTAAARFLARNVGAISLQVLCHLQWSQARFIWDIIEAELLDSLDVFIKFATAFPMDMHACKALNLSLAELPQALSLIIPRLNKDTPRISATSSLPWSLHLDLSHVPLESDVLLQLGRVPGLTVLKINDSNIDDSTINHWARSQSAAGFAHLRVLDIRANPLKKPEVCMKKLIQFPELRLIKCDVSGAWSDLESAGRRTTLDVLWQDLQSHQGAVIEMKVHLGSRADRRPLQPSAEETIIDVPLARAQLSAKQAQSRPGSQGETVNSRNKKRQKKLGGSGDIWQQVLSKA